MKAFFYELFQYNQHSNRRIVAVLEQNKAQVTPKCLSLLSHLLNAHGIWNQKIRPELISYKSWELHPIESAYQIDSLNHDNSLELLESFVLDQAVNYKLSTGKAFTNSVRDILFQIINHSTYHRAQIATEFRNSGIDPLLTDYIAYQWK